MLSSLSSSARSIPFIVLILLTILAAGFRVHYFRETAVKSLLRADARQYAIYGYNLYTKGTFSKETDTRQPKPDSYRAPGFPFLVAAGMKFFGLEGGFLRFILILHIVLGVLLVPLIYWAARFVLGKFLSAGSAFLVAISPHLITIGGNFLTETSFAFIHFAGLALFLAALRKKNRVLLIIPGLFFGYAYLINPVILFLPFILVFAVMVGEKIPFREWGKTLAKNGLAGFLVVFCLFAVGWGLRNQVSLPENALTSTDRVINNLVIGSHYDFFDNYRKDPRGPEYMAVQKEIGQARGTFRGFFRGFLPRLADEPIRYAAWYLIEKPLLFFGWGIQFGAGDIYVYPVADSPYQKPGLFRSSRAVMKLIHGPLVLLLLGGIPASLVLWLKGRMGPGSPEALLFLTMFYFTLIHVVLQAEPRLSVPFRPEFYILSLLTIRTLVTRIRKPA